MAISRAFLASALVFIFYFEYFDNTYSIIIGALPPLPP